MSPVRFIGFTWVYPKGPDKDELIEWGKQYCWLVNFHKDRGHCNVPSKIAGKENPVAAWCDEQRRLHVERKLDQGKLDKLTRLGFDFYGSSTDDDNEDGPANKRQRTGGNIEDAKTIKNLQEKVRVQEEEITGLKQKIEMLEKKHAAK